MAQVGYFGQIKEFNSETDDFSIYSERMDQFFLVNGIKAEDPRRAGILLTSIANNTFKLLQDLCVPLKPKDMKYEELMLLLSDHVSPKRSVFAERCKFHRALQDSNESIQEWTAKLKRLSRFCKFEQNLDATLRDRFIVGLRNEAIVNQLFMAPETITFAGAVEIATKVETARSQVVEVKREGPITNEKVCRYEHSKRGNSSKPQNKQSHSSYDRHTRKEGAYSHNVKLQDSNDRCKVCGKGNHNTKDCKYSSYKCNVCGIVGHLAKVCRKKNIKSKGKQCHFNKEEDDSDVPLFTLQSKKRTKPIIINVCIGDVGLAMEIDSGAGVSVINAKLYYELFKKYKLQCSDVILRNYTQGADRPIGMFEPEIIYKDRIVRCKIHVIEKGGPPLCGRDLMSLLGIGFTNIHNLSASSTLEDILQEFKPLFENSLGTYKYGKVSLLLKPESKPIFFKPRALPFAFKDKVEEELIRLEKEGIITSIESSDWGTPLVPVLKKDGTLRLCADYKVTLNKYLEEVKYPLPRIEELFTKLQGGQEFSKLDLSQAYNQLRMDDKSQRMATWSTHKGLFKVNRLPYGVSPVAAKFQKMLEQLLQGLDGVVNFLDDIVITGNNKKEHMLRLRKVLSIIQDAGLKLKLDKCEFFKKEITYLGYVIEARGLRKDPNKVKAILEALPPTSVTQVRSLVGMISYYGKFVPRLAEKMRPCYELLHKDAEFRWTKECQDAFEDIKKIMSSEQVLVHYDPKLSIKLSCDASKDGIGAVLAHIYPNGEERPIAYAAKSLSKAEKGYSMVDKEALAIYFAVKHFHQYLYSRHFILATDHKPLVALFGEHRGIPQMAASRLQRWALFLSGYNYTIQYVQGKNNGNADYLSRLPQQEEQTEDKEESSYLHFVAAQEELPVDCTKIKIETHKDPVLSRVCVYVNTTWPEEQSEELKPYFTRKEQLTVEQGCLMWGYRVVVPSTLRKQLLEELHMTHMGMVKMKYLARSYIWWPLLDQEIEQCVRGCSSCAEMRPDPPKASVIPWQYPKSVWERVHADLLGPLRGKMYLILIDAHSKWPEVFPMDNITTELTICKLRETFARFGLPTQLVTDNGTQFTSSAFKEFVKRNGIKHSLTAPGHPATNGQAENGVKSFKLGIYKALNDLKNANLPIQTLIARYLLTYRNTLHCTTLETPAKLMFGRELRIRLDMVRPSREGKVKDKQEKQMSSKGRKEVILAVGSAVMVRDYRVVNQKTWVRATILKCLGPRTFLCKVGDKTWKRHINQITTNIEVKEMERGEEVKDSTDISTAEVPCPSIIREEPTMVREEPKAEEKQLTSAKSRPKRHAKPPDRLNL